MTGVQGQARVSIAGTCLPTLPCLRSKGTKARQGPLSHAAARNISYSEAHDSAFWQIWQPIPAIVTQRLDGKWRSANITPALFPRGAQKRRVCPAQRHLCPASILHRVTSITVLVAPTYFVCTFVCSARSPCITKKPTAV